MTLECSWRRPRCRGPCAAAAGDGLCTWPWAAAECRRAEVQHESGDLSTPPCLASSRDCPPRGRLTAMQGRTAWPRAGSTSVPVALLWLMPEGLCQLMLLALGPVSRRLGVGVGVAGVGSVRTQTSAQH